CLSITFYTKQKKLKWAIVPCYFQQKTYFILGPKYLGFRGLPARHMERLLSRFGFISIIL
ncbi:MAG: hypothetical protein KAI33_03765, partial [Elusimicrobiales bacterium]|nr:hypothetical protein [Elusimicrobiales bacterium]